MLAEASRRKRRWPRWWRRVQVAARRANIFAVIEVVAVTAFLLMTAIAWRALSNQTERGKLLPSELTATLLIGMRLSSIPSSQTVARGPQSLA